MDCLKEAREQMSLCDVYSFEDFGPSPRLSEDVGFLLTDCVAPWDCSDLHELLLAEYLPKQNSMKNRTLEDFKFNTAAGNLVTVKESASVRLRRGNVDSEDDDVVCLEHIQRNSRSDQSSPSIITHGYARRKSPPKEIALSDDRMRKKKKKKLFLCPLCYTFTQSIRSLQGHMRCHGSNRKYQCDVPNCDASFNFRGSLNKHQKNAHKSEHLKTLSMTYDMEKLIQLHLADRHLKVTS